MAFVRIASEEFGIRGRPTNLSRVSAMTGIPRKDVSRIRQTVNKYDIDFRVELSPLGDVLHRWHTSPEFLDESGVPRRLHFGEGEYSFVSLVKQCVGDVPAGAIRVELIRSGAVLVDDEGKMILKRRHVVPEGSVEKLVSSIAFSLRSLAETIAFNCAPGRKGPGRIERFVQSDYLDQPSRQKLRQLLRERISSYTEEVDDMFYEHASPPNTDDCTRIGVGIFYFEDTDKA
jgi:hypothetical protein